MMGALVLAGGLCGVRPAAAAMVQDQTIVHGGLTRYFDFYQPSRLPAGPMPLLFVLHGGTGSNKTTEPGIMGRFMIHAELEKFVVIYPNGTSALTRTSGASGSFNWNDCRDDAGGAQTTADDVGFISALIDWASKRWKIDPQRVYAMGGSNGGMMSYRLAIQLSDRIAAVAALIANLPVSQSDCPARPAQPVSVLIAGGTLDAFMPWDGGNVVGERGSVLSAIDTRNYWRTFLGTGSEPRIAKMPDVDATDESDVEERIYCGGRDGTRVAFYRMNGAGHTFPSRAIPIGDYMESVLGPQNRDVETATVVWNFLKRQRLGTTPGVCGDGCLDPGEACDDGNTAGGDCCNATCSLGVTCSVCEVCDPSTRTCGAAVQAMCADSTSGTLVLRDARTGGDGLRWRSRGAEVLPSTLGDPATTDDLTVCVYDAANMVLGGTVLGAGGRCGDMRCWKRLTKGGARLFDPKHVHSPISRATVTTAGKDGGKIAIVGKGVALGVPALADVQLPVRIQMTSTAGGCFQSVCAGRRGRSSSRFAARCGGS